MTIRKEISECDMPFSQKNTCAPSRLSSLARTSTLALAGMFSMASGHTLVSAEHKQQEERKQETISPEELRFRHRLETTLQDAAKRWDVLKNVTINEKGDQITLNAPLPKKEDALFFTRNETGHLDYLCIKTGNTIIDIHPLQRDLRKTTRTDTDVRYDWMTEKDHIIGQRSFDNTVQKLHIEGLGSIDPYESPYTLLEKFSTPHQIFLFLQVFRTYKAPIHKDGSLNILEFIATFRRDLATLQRDEFIGVCNTDAEVSCEALADNDQHMFVLTFWPKGILHGENAFGEWHQAAGMKHADGSWTIIDGSMEELRYMSPKDYAEFIGMEHARFPIIGTLPWSHPHSSQERLLQHVQ